MSNKPPKINPTGTTYKAVPIWIHGQAKHGAHSKVWLKMMDVIGEYMRADYIVEYSEREEYSQSYAYCICRPPLFPNESPQ